MRKENVELFEDIAIGNVSRQSFRTHRRSAQTLTDATLLLPNPLNPLSTTPSTHYYQSYEITHLPSQSKQ